LRRIGENEPNWGRLGSGGGRGHGLGTGRRGGDGGWRFRFHFRLFGLFFGAAFVLGAPQLG